MAIASSSPETNPATPLEGSVGSPRNLPESPLMEPWGLGRSQRPPMMDSPRPNVASQSYGGSLQQGDDLNPTRFQCFKDDYWLTLEQSGWVEVHLTSQALDPYLQVIDSLTGEILVADDDGGEGLNSSLRFQGEKGDRIILRASSYEAAETGDYRLTIQGSFQTETDSASPPTKITAPGILPPVSGSVDTETDHDSMPPLSDPARSRPLDPASEPNRFDVLRGYGLVNAAAAIAQIQSRPLLTVPPAGSSPLDAIGASTAWDNGATGAGVVVAVIDSGLDIDHPELQGSIWRNPGEIEGDGIDNDRNGYVDDIHGWNLGLGQNNNDVRPGSDVNYQGHGTHVAGIIPAARDGVGNTGVAYDAKIMTLRLGDATTRGTFRNAGSLVEAIYYAVDNGANVINLSLGWSDSPALQTALAYAADHDVITVSAAGNSGNQASPLAPARYADRWGISVGAVNGNGDLALFSNQAGDNPALRHVLAPGRQISSGHPGNRYRRRSGTSMATPFVSGVVALMLSTEPNLSAAQVRDILTATASSPSGTEAWR